MLYTDTYYEDLRGSTSFKLGGGNDPNLVQYPAVNGGYLYAFDSGDELGLQFQLQHAWKIGTDLDLHLHWTPRGNGVAENGNTVNWRVDLSAAGIGQAFPAVTTYVLTDTCPGTDDEHLIIDATVAVPGSALTLSSVLVGRVYRLAGDTWAGLGGGGAPLLLEVDFHIQKDRPGSRQEYVK